MRNSAQISALALFALVSPLPALAERPLSAIDWLSSSVATPAGSAIGPAIKPAKKAEPPVSSSGALPNDVAVSKLDGNSPDGLGLLAPDVTGLPRNLWGMGLETEVIAAITGSRNDLLPALQSMMQTLMLAQATPPIDSMGKGNLLIARIDQLLAMGALEPAKGLLSAAAPDNPEIFRRAFDVALLTGNEEEGCIQMQRSPTLAPTFPARIFCLARSGDWNAAALTLRTAQVLGHVSDEEDALLSRFLDPDLYEGEDLPGLPPRMTPLSWRMFEAIGEPISTTGLPLAFSHAELRDTAGWRSQIEAAERLARAGAIPASELFTLYGDRVPAASGGVWDRVAAVQAFDRAIESGQADDVSKTLIAVWPQITQAELEVPFAKIYADRLSRIALQEEAATLGFEIGLLSPLYQDVAAKAQPTTTRDRFLAGLALGNLRGLTPPDSLGRAIAPAFLGTKLRDDLQRLDDEGRIGEALIFAANMIAQGVQGELPRVTEGLAYLRHAGLEDIARRTALELMLLERRG